jgi:phage shock protein PspC (stress-responsive transcriptional regulator)
MLGGVCGGLADYTGIDAVLWRVGFVALTVIGVGAGVLVYLLLWVLMDPGAGDGNQPTGPVDRLAGQLHEKVYGSGWMPPRT